MSSNNDSVATSYAKVAALEEKITELQRSVRAEINMLNTKRAYLARRNQDLNDLAQESIDMLRDETLLVSMMEEKADGQFNRSKLDLFTEKAEYMVMDVTEEMGKDSENNQ